MKKEIQSMLEMKLIGICVRTNNAQEANPETSKIGALLAQFFSQNMAQSIPDRKNRGVTICCYTEYDSDAQGDYLYFVGEEVTSLNDIPDFLKGLTISASKYTKFTTDEGQMPAVVISAWQEIWQMSAYNLGGERTFQADFEIYDHRALDPARTVVDLFIGIK